MTVLLHLLRNVVLAALVGVIWQAGEQAVHAQALLAQTGAAKTAIGYALFLLSVILGLLVICRPSGRQWQYTEDELREQQAKKQGQLRR